MTWFVLAITVWRWDTADYHPVYSDPMPLEACEVLAAKVNVPLLFSPAPFNARAECVAAPPPRGATK